MYNWPLQALSQVYRIWRWFLPWTVGFFVLRCEPFIVSETESFGVWHFDAVDVHRHDVIVRADGRFGRHGTSHLGSRRSLWVLKHPCLQCNETMFNFMYYFITPNRQGLHSRQNCAEFTYQGYDLEYFVLEMSQKIVPFRQGWYTPAFRNRWWSRFCFLWLHWTDWKYRVRSLHRKWWPLPHPYRSFRGQDSCGPSVLDILET